MSKQAEIEYLDRIGEAGRQHSLLKPFSNGDCGLTLASIGTIMALMPPPPAKVLDLGCGGGWSSTFFSRHGYDVLGQDISADMICLAEETKLHNRAGDNLSFVVSDYETLKLKNEFDCAVFFDCLHHADDECAALKSAFDALKPGGIIITHEPGKGHSTNPHSIEAMELYGVNERDMPPQLIISQAERIGFCEPRIFPMQHDIFNYFYQSHPPKKLWSKSGIKFARRVLNLIFFPSLDASAIVTLRKPI